MMTTSSKEAEALEFIKESGLLRSGSLIGGSYLPSSQGNTFPVTSPATGDLLFHVSLAAGLEASKAVDSAELAFASWSRTTAKERSKILRSWYDLIVSHREQLAILMTLEQGKPLAEARGEVDYGAAYVELYAEEAKRGYGDIIPAALQDRKILVTRQPVGVVGIITPWNFPLAMIARKIAPALAAGCTTVIKPAELTPLTAFALAELAARAGVPAGVINVVAGDAPAIGQAILGSDKVRKLSFTGSTPVGRKLMAMASDTVKRLSLELGGNAPFIVFDDADIPKAVKGAMAAKFRNAGQTCVCANRIFVQDGVHDQFVASLIEQVKALKVGHGLDEGVTQGPLINEAAVEKVARLIGDAESKGGTVVVGGKRHPLGSTFFEPTVILGATPDMGIFSEEAFGPVAPIFKFTTEEQAVSMANDTEFGLAAYVYTQDIARSWRVTEALQYGMVGLNEAVISSEAAPFGGVKQSGFGREGSKYGMEEYQSMKYVCLGGL